MFTGVEENDGSTVLKDCHKQKVTGFSVEACFCTEDECNTAAPHAAIHSIVTVALPTIATLIFSRILR